MNTPHRRTSLIDWARYWFCRSRLTRPSNQYYFGTMAICLIVVYLLSSQCHVIKQKDASSLKRYGVTAFSSDNRRLFMDVCSASDKCNVAVLNLDSMRLALLQPYNREHMFSSPSPSIDGKHLTAIVRQATDAYATQIAIIDTESGKYSLVTNSKTFKAHPSFSANKEKIVYAQAGWIRPSGRVRATAWDLHEIDLHKQQTRQITDNCFYTISRPQYMPDGLRILFSGDPACNFPENNGKTVSIKDTHNAYTSTYKENTIFLVKKDEILLRPLIISGLYSGSPMLSADGKKIAYVSRTNELDGKAGKFNYDLFLHESGYSRRLTDLGTYIRSAAFSQDGNHIAFISDKERNGKHMLWLIDVQTGYLQQIGINDESPLGIITVDQMYIEELLK